MAAAHQAPFKLMPQPRNVFCQTRGRSRPFSHAVGDFELPVVPTPLRPYARRQIAGYNFRRPSRSPILCSGKELSENVGPDISALNKTLQQQWDHTANLHLGSIVITKFSNEKVWWQCHQCPHGHLHQWQANVHSRSSGAGCPQCAGQKLCKHNSLATKAPKVAIYWDTIRNGCTADMVLAYSNKMSHWQCHSCGHKWTAKPNAKALFGTGCPVCSRQGRKRIKQPTFAQCRHPLLAEWDHQKNAAQGLFPDKITLKSNKKVHWHCNKCPLGQRHAWVAEPAKRTSKRQHGCPFCTGRAACKCNSLQTHYPSIAAEWDQTKNDLTPQDLTAGSGVAVWWRNADRGSWQQTINSRTRAVSQDAVKKQYLKDNLDS